MRAQLPDYLILLLLCSTLFPIAASAQYFQQQTDYKIEVNLDPKTHMLRGEWSMTYHNNSPDTLTFLYMHLWPNAFSHKSTAFAKEELKHGHTDFYFAEEDELGFIDSLDFTTENVKLRLEYTAEHRDIARLYLDAPLFPGSSVSLQSSFRVRIPQSVSRLGRVGRSYQVSQWYPKPAVYDSAGWHPMPNLNLGEFYSEFGSFDVTIHAPANMLVAATGDQRREDAKEYIESLALLSVEEQREKITAQRGMRTWQFAIDSVHDFAWFTDPTFVVLKETAKLDNGREVNCWAYFPYYQLPLWGQVPKYLSRSVKYLSTLVGSYPYINITAVQSSLSKGVNMEYPTITLIGYHSDAELLDQVIMHEVGHNWFYGILGSNERETPWMDEGLNSYYEQRYMLEYYNSKVNNILPEYVRKHNPLQDPQLYLAYKARINQLLSPSISSVEMDEGNYYLGAYERPSLAFAKLAAFIGQEKFDRAIQAYYEKWSFKHPAPENLRSVLEEHCTCNLDWLFNNLLASSSLPDMKISSSGSKGEILLSNLSGDTIPWILAGIDSSGRVLFSENIEPFHGEMKFALPTDGPYTLYADAPLYQADPTPWNNLLNISPEGKASRSARVRVPIGVGGSDPWTLNLGPALGWNEYDNGMLGLTLANNLLFPRKFRFALAPMYSTQAKDLVGLGTVSYVSNPRTGLFSEVNFSLGAKRFHFFQHPDYGYFDSYFKVQPSISLVLKKPNVFSKTEHKIRYRQVYISQEYGRGINLEERIFEVVKRNYSVHELRYLLNNSSALRPSQLNFTVQAGQGFVQLTTHYNQFFKFKREGKGLWIHGFAGYFPVFDEPEAYVPFQFSGSNGITGTNSSVNSRDYLYDELLFGRSASKGVFSRQIWLRDAQLKTLSNVGISDDWMLGFGADLSLPLPVPLHVYGDVAVFPDIFEEGQLQLSYSAGISLVLAKNFMELYIPLFESSDIEESVIYDGKNGVFERVTFLFDLNKLAPFPNVEQTLQKF